MVHLTPVDSSVISHYGYDESIFTLYIRFHSGKCYEYLHVPVTVWRDLQKATSKGRFFNDVVRSYEYTASEC